MLTPNDARMIVRALIDNIAELSTVIDTTKPVGSESFRDQLIQMARESQQIHARNRK